MRDSVKFRQQFDAVLPSDQNTLQCLAVLLHLLAAHSRHQPSQWTRQTRKSKWIIRIGFQYLHLIFSKNAIQNEVSPEHRPLTFNVLKELEFCGIVVQPRWILEGQQSRITAEPSSSDYIVHNHSDSQTRFRKFWPLLGSDIHPWWSDNSHNDPEEYSDGRNWNLRYFTFTQTELIFQKIKYGNILLKFFLMNNYSGLWLELWFFLLLKIY